MMVNAVFQENQQDTSLQVTSFLFFPYTLLLE